MNDTLVSLTNISAVKGTKLVLKDLSWSTKKGEHWFILGNNGSGKSTLLEIVLGYHWPQSGEVSVLNQRFGQCLLADVRMKIGFVAPWVIKRNRSSLCVYNVIASGLDASIGIPDKVSNDGERRIRKQSKFFACDAFLRTEFGVLSSGEQMRAILARAMVNEPEILILDEPFAHLDMHSRVQMYQLLARLAVVKSGPQILLVTHYLQDVVKMFTHGLVLKNGRVVLSGPKNFVLNSPVLAEKLDIPKSHMRMLEVIE
ncbi:MAG: ATP-binding cassette domain-containing protein [Candidatus Omnitrophica bacterium]|nr:ATP-binding cassette domain-containing protein [Candidatus Omnitrophota bacterium]